MTIKIKCGRCGELFDESRKIYLNKYIVCERCYWKWRKHIKTKAPLEFKEWLKEVKKPNG